MIEIKIKKLNSEAVIPTVAHEGNAGMDVVAVSKTWLEELCCWEYGLGFSTEIPMGYKGIIVPRSSISKYDLIMCNSPAQIDFDYRGEWKVRFKDINYISNINKFRKTYDVGDKIAQVFFEPVLSAAFVVAEELTETVRGEGGFGSTTNK